MQQTAGSVIKGRKIKTFWAIAAIVVVALVAGGLVYWFQFQLSYDEEINAIQLRATARNHQVETAKPDVKDSSVVSSPAKTNKK